MLRLNLLPQFQQQEFEWERNRRLAILVGGTLFLFLVIFSLLLLSAKLYIDIQLAPIETEIGYEKKRTETKEARELEEKITSFSQNVTNLAKIQKNQEKWSEILEKIAEILPRGITISSLSVIKKTLSSPGDEEERSVKEVRIIGHADTRSQLLELKEVLKKDPQLQDLIFPASLFIKEADIDFAISFNYLKP